ncbi:Ankyrin repeat and KH domain-containing protein mask [Diplonema papillatum]|nr:Ankyrin repeat and KH domain-containing protein mask [Diplonema papillatum]
MAGIDAITDRTRRGATGLILASYQGHADVVSRLLRTSEGRAAVDSTNTHGATALLVASQMGHESVVKELLSAGADVNAATNDSWTALILASVTGNSSVVKELLSAGADVNAARRYDGSTALIRASYGGHASVVTELLSAGADVNAAMKDGRTALIYASEKGHESVVKELLSAGADVNAARRYDGSTALICAGGRESIVTKLLSAGASVNHATTYGYTALIYASKEGHESVVKELLSAGADVNAATNRSWTALIYASKEGHESVVKELLSAGADVNAATNRSWTALILASEKGHESVVKELLSAGADVNAATIDSWTALTSASVEGHESVVKELLSAGADVPRFMVTGAKPREHEADVVADLRRAGWAVEPVSAFVRGGSRTCVVATIEPPPFRVLGRRNAPPLVVNDYDRSELPREAHKKLAGGGAAKTRRVKLPAAEAGAGPATSPPATQGTKRKGREPEEPAKAATVEPGILQRVVEGVVNALSPPRQRLRVSGEDEEMTGGPAIDATAGGQEQGGHRHSFDTSRVSKPKNGFTCAICKEEKLPKQVRRACKGCDIFACQLCSKC